ncbi:aromatic motif membrane protein [Mycoplasma tauri]|uniref:aromatic motif membrane protein n=1 Tax=Mycoplasma tauri TaxID=547987 RepID=UPI001CBC4994|nr:aromatic motif membrane protein [Mycoplasma tauri]MBZ4218410.1 hypothetical protein [Mycoplasma tauri]
MIKWFLGSLPTILLPLSIFSSLHISNKKNNNVIVENTKKSGEKLYKNQYINNMLNIFTENENNKKDIYVSIQENISHAKIDELKFAFVYNPIFIQKSVHDKGETSELAKTSKNVIRETLSNDWYWTLNNITKLIYNFNPYGDRYTTFDNEKKWFDTARENFGSLLMQIKNPLPTKLIKIPFNEIEQLKKYNSYTEKENWYLFFDNNKAIKIWKYKKNNEVKFQILPDLLIFSNLDNIENKLIEFENSIHSKRKKTIEREYNEAKEWAELDGEEFDEKDFFKDYVDEKYMEFQALYRYNGYFVDTLNEINKDKLKVFRFSMRFINE